MAGEPGLIEALLARGQSDPRALFRAAEALRRQGNEVRAIDACTAALDRAGGDGELALLCRLFLSCKVERWHFPMLSDARRTAVYRAAIERAVKPGMRVLEIGTGSGILAMMAVRAGAGHVHTCEADPAIAHVARDIIAANGMGDRITILARHSTTLDAEADLGGRADLLLSEIIASDLIGEGVLPAHEHAMAELLVPGAPVLPASGTIRIALATLDHYDHAPVGSLEGFDLSGFNRLRRPVRNITASSPDLRLVSEPADPMAFDFTRAAYRAPDRATCTLRSNGGRVDGLALWMRLRVDDEAVYDTDPGPEGSRSWIVRYFPFHAPSETTFGEAIAVHVAHDRDEVIAWAD